MRGRERIKQMIDLESELALTIPLTSAPTVGVMVASLSEG